MRGKHYDEGKRRVFSNGGYIGLIIVIIVLAALVATTLLVLLPSTEEIKTDAPKIVSIQYPDNEIGAGSSLDKIYLTVTYSDGKTESVALSSMIHEGLDITSDTQQEIFVSYGGFEDTIIVNVKKVDGIVAVPLAFKERIEQHGIEPRFTDLRNALFHFSEAMAHFSEIVFLLAATIAKRIDLIKYALVKPHRSLRKTKPENACERSEDLFRKEFDPLRLKDPYRFFRIIHAHKDLRGIVVRKHK